MSDTLGSFQSSYLGQYNPSLNALVQILAKLTRRGLYYCRKRINLDGLTFEECSFENCEFYTETGNFTLIRCRIYGPETTFIYGGQALKVARLYEFMNSSVNNRIIFPYIYPTRDADGKISI